MGGYSRFVGKQVDLALSGNLIVKGEMIDAGLDLVVVRGIVSNHYYCVPSVHIRRIKEVDRKETPEKRESPEFVPTPDMPIAMEAGPISFRKLLMSAKGHFVQLYASGSQPVHGYMTHIMNDYFVFYSPACKAMYVSMNHVKWLIPYEPDATPYSLDNRYLPVNPSPAPLARTFEEQCKKLMGQMVLLDGGGDEKIGLLESVADNRLGLVTADRKKVFWNMAHIKTIQVP